MRPFPLLLAPEAPLTLSPKTSGQSVVWSWCGGNVARPFVDTVPIIVGSLPFVKSRYGAGFGSPGGTNRATYARGVPITAFQAGCTIEILCAITAAASLAGFVSTGFTAANPGTARGLIAFAGASSRNIYFWAGSAGSDVASGVDWRVDGRLQHVFVTIDGGSGAVPIKFYRDGLVIASGTTGADLAAITTSAVRVGDTNEGWAASPVGTIHKIAYYNRALTASEVWDKTQDPYGDYVADAAAPYAFVVAAGGVFTPYYYHSHIGAMAA